MAGLIDAYKFVTSQLPLIPTGITVGEVSTIPITSTSTLASWRAFSVTNSGSELNWDVSGGVTGNQNGSNPIFDFSGNSGTANISVTGINNFSGLTQMNFQTVDLDITSIDIDQCLDLTLINLSNGDLITSLNISENTLLTTVVVFGCDLSSSEIDNIIIQLDNNGLSNGLLNYDSQFNGATPSSTSLTAYNNLISKSWTIVGSTPS